MGSNGPSHTCMYACTCMPAGKVKQALSEVCPGSDCCCHKSYTITARHDSKVSKLSLKANSQQHWILQASTIKWAKPDNSQNRKKSKCSVFCDRSQTVFTLDTLSLRERHKILSCQTHLAILHSENATVSNIVLVIIVGAGSIHGFPESDVDTRLHSAGPLGNAVQPFALSGALHDQHIPVL